jgi:hypothetical protein
VVAPITHSPPTADLPAVELPAAVKKHLGLDDERSWVIVDEVNVFEWPGHDLDVTPSGGVAYGLLPPKLFNRIKASLLAEIRAGRLRRVSR